MSAVQAPHWRVEVDTSSAAPVFRVRSLAELRVRRSGAYWIKGIAPKPGVTLVFGPSGSGKTFLVGHAALAGATGVPFFGRRVQAGAVAYVAAENPASVELRFAAWRDARGLQTDRLYVVDGPINLAEPTALEALLASLRALALTQGGLCAVVVDTAAAAAPGIDENSSADMGRLIAACLAMRDEFGAAVVLVHHAGKDAGKGARGHSSLRAAVDAEIEVSELPGGGRCARVTKSRDGCTGDALHFDLETIDLGADDDGDPMSTCRVIEQDGCDRHAARSADLARLPPEASIALQAIRELVEMSTEVSPGTSTMPAGKRLVSIDDWRGQYRARRGRLTDDSDPNERTRELRASKVAFQRSTAELQQRHIVGTWEGKAWLW